MNEPAQWRLGSSGNNRVAKRSVHLVPFAMFFRKKITATEMAAALLTITVDERTHHEPLELFSKIEGVDLKRVHRELLLLGTMRATLPRQRAGRKSNPMVARAHTLYVEARQAGPSVSWHAMQPWWCPDIRTPHPPRKGPCANNLERRSIVTATPSNRESGYPIKERNSLHPPCRITIASEVQLTREQLQSRKDKAVRFTESVLGDSGRASEIEDESLEDYAERRHIQLSNPKRRKALMASKVDLQNRVDELEAENAALSEQLDTIADIVAPDDEDADDVDEDEDDEEDDQDPN